MQYTLWSDKSPQVYSFLEMLAEELSFVLVRGGQACRNLTKVSNKDFALA